MSKNPVLIVLGTVQDGGFPQSGCFDDCCRLIDKNNSQEEQIKIMNDNIIKRPLINRVRFGSKYWKLFFPNPLNFHPQIFRHKL